MAKVAALVAAKPGGKQVTVKLELVKERAYLESGQVLSVHHVCRQCPYAQTFTFVPPEQYRPGGNTLPMKQIVGRDGKPQLACVLPPPPHGGSPRVLRVGRPTTVEVVICCKAECPIFQAQAERYKPPQDRSSVEERLDLIQNPCRFCTFYDHCAQQLGWGFVD